MLESKLVTRMLILAIVSALMRRGWLKLSRDQAEQRVKRMFPPALADAAEAQLRSGVFPDALGPSYAELAGRDFTAVLREYPGPSLILNGEPDRPRICTVHCLGFKTR